MLVLSIFCLPDSPNECSRYMYFNIGRKSVIVDIAHDMLLFFILWNLLQVMARQLAVPWRLPSDIRIRSVLVLLYMSCCVGLYGTTPGKKIVKLPWKNGIDTKRKCRREKHNYNHKRDLYAQWFKWFVKCSLKLAFMGTCNVQTRTYPNAALI